MASWLLFFYYYFAYSTVIVDVKGKERIDPVVVSESYISSKHGNSSTYFANQYIECRSDICEVTCDVPNGGCHNLMINASLSTSLMIDCNEAASCTQLVVMAPSSDLEIQCTESGACSDAHVYAQSTSTTINVECASLHACRGMVVEADAVMNELNVNCIDDDACFESTIHCPQKGACNIQCLSETSCQSLALFINDALDNTLNLECDNSTECTGAIHTNNAPFTTTTTFRQNASTNALYCDTYNPGACPFIVDTITCAADSDCVVDCSNATMTSCAGHYIDATNANSLSLQCGSGAEFGCRMALIQCPIRNDTICNIICNSCAQIFIKPSTNSSISCSGALSCDHMLLSLNSVSGGGLTGHLNELRLECDGDKACQLASVVDDHNDDETSSIDIFSMKCNGYQTCAKTTVDLQMNHAAVSNHYVSSQFNLICSGRKYTCYRMKVSFIGNIDHVSIECGDESTKADDSACSDAVITHSGGQSIKEVHFGCYGHSACAYSDTFFYGESIGELVWDCMSNESVATYSPCRRAELVLEASVDEVNVTCSGQEACYYIQLEMGSATTDHAATIDRFNLKCIDDSVQSCNGADIRVYSGKRIQYLGIECDGADQACYDIATNLYGNAVIEDWNQECFDTPTNCDYTYMFLYDDSIVSHANVNCRGDAPSDDFSCHGIYYDFSQTRTSSETLEMVYNCNTPHACEGGDIVGDHLPSTLDVTLNCNAPDSCRNFKIDNSGQLGKFTLNCNGTNACNGMTVECPMMNENGCHIECSAHKGSCANIDIVALVDTYPFGYLDLQCPSPETSTNHSPCDGITIGCSQTKLDVAYIYDDSAQQYTCSNASEMHCCPLNGISSNPTAHPTTITLNPTVAPTGDPSSDPSTQPTYHPTVAPTGDPSSDPSTQPTYHPTVASQAPTIAIAAGTTDSESDSGEGGRRSGSESDSNAETTVVIVVIIVIVIVIIVFIARDQYGRRKKEHQHETEMVGAEPIAKVASDGSDSDSDGETTAGGLSP